MLRPGLNLVNINTKYPGEKRIVWPSSGLFDEGLMLDPSLIQTNNVGQAIVLITNCNNRAVRCPKRLGWMLEEAIEMPEVCKIERTGQSEDKKMDTSKPEWLKAFKWDATELTKEEKYQVEQLLDAHKDAISLYIHDLGYNKIRKMQN